MRAKVIGSEASGLAGVASRANATLAGGFVIDA